MKVCVSFSLFYKVQSTILLSLCYTEGHTQILLTIITPAYVHIWTPYYMCVCVCATDVCMCFDVVCEEYRIKPVLN